MTELKAKLRTLLRTKRSIAGAGITLLVVAGVITIFALSGDPKESVSEVHPTKGEIKLSISSTGSVEPENRLEVKPPIAGRIIEILVKEGDKVKVGDIIAWMSSTERAAILDAARAKNKNDYEYWNNAYKPTPLIAPINGEVIVSTDQPGQTVTTSEAVIVLSDKLIVKAQVDETDIGGIKIGQRSIITLDAYPDIKIEGVVERIAYESKIVNNVTTYLVYIQPSNVPDVYRSGMSTNVEIIEEGKEDVLILPMEAVKLDKDGPFVFLDHDGDRLKKRVVTGLADDKNVEIVSGLSEEDTVVIVSQKYNPSNNANGASNPFMPFGRKR